MDKLQIINLTLFIVAAIAFALFFYITYATTCKDKKWFFISNGKIYLFLYYNIV